MQDGGNEKKKKRERGCLEPPQGSDIEPANRRMKDKGWGEGPPNVDTAHAKALWLERVSPTWGPARG